MEGEQGEIWRVALQSGFCHHVNLKSHLIENEKSQQLKKDYGEKPDPHFPLHDCPFIIFVIQKRALL